MNMADKLLIIGGSVAGTSFVAGALYIFAEMNIPMFLRCAYLVTVAGVVLILCSLFRGEA